MLAKITHFQGKLEQFFICLYSNEFVWMSPTFQSHRPVEAEQYLQPQKHHSHRHEQHGLPGPSQLMRWKSLVADPYSLKSINQRPKCSHFCYCLHYLWLGFVYFDVQFISFSVFRHFFLIWIAVYQIPSKPLHPQRSLHFRYPPVLYFTYIFTILLW